MLNPEVHNDPFWKKYFPQFFLLVFFTGFLSFQYGDTFLSPNNHLFTASGDGIKNYYTYAYHIKNDSSYLHFGGLNYPYGEHIGYTDGHPLLSWFFQTFPFLAGNKIGILNFLLLSGMIVTAILFYAVLRKYGVRKMTALLASIGYTLLQPQIFRLGGHLSLGHSFFFLLGWYLLLLSREKENKITWSILFALHTLIWFFIHPYAGMILSFFACGFWFFYLSRQLIRREVIPGKNWIMAMIQCVAPAIIFLLFMKLSDPHTNRTDQPGGTLEYTASVETVFLPSHPPLRHMLGQVVEIKSQEWEGWAYIGLSTIIILLSIIAGTITYLIKTKNLSSTISKIFPYEMGPLVLTSLIALFFSMGYPIKWNPELLEYAGPLKQFRGLGRFAWIFFYIITIYSVIIYEKWQSGRSGNKRIMSAAGGIILFIIIIVESLPHHDDTSKMISGSKNLFDLEQLSLEQKEIIDAITNESITAILPLPWFHFGSEFYGTETDEETMLISFIASYHCGLPLIAGATGRTSLQEARNMFSVLAPDYWKKNLKNKFSNDDEILLLVKKPSSSGNEKMLIEKSKFIFKNNEASLYKIKATDLFAQSTEEEINNFMKSKNSLHLEENLYITDTSDKSLHFDDFTYEENGVLFANREDNHTLLIIEPGILDTGVIYEAVYQYEALTANALNRIAVVESAAAEGGDVNWFYQRKISSYYMHDDDHTYVVIKFRIDHPGKRYFLTIKGNPEIPFAFTVDNLLLHEEKNTIYYIEDDQLYMNGIPLISGDEKQPGKN